MCPGQSDSKLCENTELIINYHFSIINCQLECTQLAHLHLPLSFIRYIRTICVRYLIRKICKIRVL